MQMVIRAISGFFLFLILLWVLAPKQEIYYLLEKKLAKNNIVISNEHFEEGIFGLTVSDADIYFEGINVAKIASLKLNVFFFYNQLDISGVETDKGIHNFVPKSIDNISATFSILKPYKITIKGRGSFGSIDGGVYLSMKKLLLRFSDTKDIHAFKKFLKKDKKGLYYEKKY